MEKAYALFTRASNLHHNYLFVGLLQEGEDVEDGHLSSISFFKGEADYDSTKPIGEYEFFLSKTKETIKSSEWPYFDII